MRRHRHSLVLALALVGGAVVLCACADEAEEREGGPGGDAAPAELVPGRVARVHVLLQPTLDPLEPEPALQVRGRFVEFRGMSEDFARGRADLLALGADRPFARGCVTSLGLPADAPEDEGEADRRELSFVDVGDLRLELGGEERVLSMALVPDVLPYLSGVEYILADDTMPRLGGDPDGRAPVNLRVDGHSTVSVDAPSAVELTVAARGAGHVFVEWRPPGASDEAMILRLQAFADDAPTGAEVTCLVADTGEVALDEAELAALGLAVGSGLVRVTAVRAAHARGEVEGFGETELVVEVRDQALLPVEARAE